MRRSAASTTTVAASAWKTPITSACFPVFFNAESRNSEPMEKAMNPSATWDNIPMDSTDSRLVNPSPSIFNAPRQYGPMSTPATKYAVTDGSRNGLNTLVIKSPARMATESDNNWYIFCFFCLEFLYYFFLNTVAVLDGR